MPTGLFIAFEGVEASGKSSQVSRLAERLRASGVEPVVVREPGGTPLAEEVRLLLLHGDHLGAGAELFLFLAARADLVDRVIRPALEEGRIVLADRYELSTRAYQGAGRGLPADRVAGAIALATGGLMPDLYVVLDLPVEVGRARQAADGKRRDRIESEEAGFHDRVRVAFRSALGPAILHLSADRDPDRIHAEVWAELVRRFPKTFGNPSG